MKGNMSWRSEGLRVVGVLLIVLGAAAVDMCELVRVALADIAGEAPPAVVSAVDAARPSASCWSPVPGLVSPGRLP